MLRGGSLTALGSVGPQGNAEWLPEEFLEWFGGVGGRVWTGGHGASVMGEGARTKKRFGIGLVVVVERAMVARPRQGLVLPEARLAKGLIRPRAASWATDMLEQSRDEAKEQGMVHMLSKDVVCRAMQVK